MHHFPDRIKEYLSVNDNFGVKLHISDESDKLLDTGGGILKAREWLDGDEPFLVHNADILTDVDLGERRWHAPCCTTHDIKIFVDGQRYENAWMD